MPNVVVTIYLNDDDYVKYVEHKSDMLDFVKKDFKDAIAKLK